MSWDGDALEGRVTDAPRADDMNLPVELQRVVEFYAR
jgi:hypothetical protein